MWSILDVYFEAQIKGACPRVPSLDISVNIEVGCKPNFFQFLSWQKTQGHTEVNEL